MFASKTPWIILLVLWMIGSTWWHVCQIKQLCVNNVPAEIVAPAGVVQMPSLLITDADQFQLSLPGNFSFARSGATANLTTLKGSLDSLTAYLKNSESGRTLTITGYYATDETNGTSFANLGLARAEGVKQYFVQQGVPAASLSTKGEVRSGTSTGEGVSSGLIFTPQRDSLYGGIGFAFGGAAVTPTASATATATMSVPATEEALAAAEKYTSVFKPIDLYFPLGEANYIKTPETTKFFDEATKYLAAHPDKKLLLTGHTDNSGSEAVNRRLARDRANGVKVRLRKSGIDQKQIVVNAKGETAPKAPNNTREGRKANRRVTVVVQ